MSSITDETRQEILAEHAKNPQRFSAFRTSKSLGIPIKDVMKVVADGRAIAETKATKHNGNGPPHLENYLVGRRRAMLSGWDNSEPEIAQAREDYEAGTHIMLTGRDGPWLLLYSIPRTGPAQPRPKYFNMETQ